MVYYIFRLLQWVSKNSKVIAEVLRTLSNKSQLYCVVYALHNIYNTVCIVFRKLLYKLNFLFRGWLNLAKSHPEVLFKCAIAPVFWHRCTGAEEVHSIAFLSKYG